MRRTTSWITALVVCGLMTPAIHGQENPDETVNALVVFQADQAREQARDQAERATLALAFAEDELAHLGASKYWIGIGIEDAAESLRSQLGLADRGAIIVTMVADDSPGKQAGLQVHDVLTRVQAGEETTDLKEVTDLTGVVTKAEKNPLRLTYLRQGKTYEVAITPTERPQPQNRLVINRVDVNSLPAAGNPERVAELLKELNALVGQQPKPVSVHFTGPVVMPPQIATVTAAPQGVAHVAVITPAGLPDNTTITITQTGKEPARVQYKQGEGKVWGATEAELNTLPPEGRQALQAVAGKLLHTGVPAFAHPPMNARTLTEHPVPFVYRYQNVEKGPNTATGAPAVAVPVPARVTQTAKPNPTADRLSQLEKQLEVLQKQQQEVIQMLKRTMEKTEQK